MKMEIKNAAGFLTSLLRLGNTLQHGQLDLFRRMLEELLRHHYQHHWFPERPFKGSGYRCIRINHKMDPLISRAGSACGLDEASLRQLFPNELTLWVDPREVSYRIGENGSICVLYDGMKNQFSADVHCLQSVNSHDGHSSFLQPDNPPSRPRYTRPSCKESLRNSSGWDCFMSDPRSVHLEQMATYVSS